MVGNRLHLAFKRQVAAKQAEIYASRNNMTCFEISPLCDFNIRESFCELARLALHRNGMERIWRSNKGNFNKYVMYMDVAQRFVTQMTISCYLLVNLIWFLSRKRLRCGVILRLIFYCIRTQNVLSHASCFVYLNNKALINLLRLLVKKTPHTEVSLFQWV